MKGVISTLAGPHRVVGNAGLTMDLLAGARLVDLEQEAKPAGTFAASWAPGVTRPHRPGCSGSLAVGGIAGLKGRDSFAQAPKSSLPFYAVVGTGDPDLTSRVAAGARYAYSWGDLGAGWRYLEYDKKSGRPIEDLNFSGATVSATYRCQSTRAAV
jgi:hypothetical protein